MRWPWSSRRASADRVLIGSDPDALAWLHADPQGRVRRCGVLERGDGPPADVERQLRALALPGGDVTAVLALHESQWLQIETPAVKVDEMKSAARWHIKDLVDTRLDELTIDVLHIGDERARELHRQMFVVAARTALVQSLGRRAQAAGLTLTAIDVAETAQRNLQSAAAESAGLGARATAALCRHGDRALLTICAGGELYHARRLDWDETELDTGPAAAPSPVDAFENLDFVDYGALNGPVDEVGAPRLVVELQRSLDLWERTWPDLPVAALWVDAGGAEQALIARLAAVLDMPARPLQADRLVPGLAEAAPTPRLREAVRPLVGALRRTRDPR